MHHDDHQRDRLRPGEPREDAFAGEPSGEAAVNRRAIQQMRKERHRPRYALLPLRYRWPYGLLCAALAGTQGWQAVNALSQERASGAFFHGAAALFFVTMLALLPLALRRDRRNAALLSELQQEATTQR